MKEEGRQCTQMDIKRLNEMGFVHEDDPAYIRPKNPHWDSLLRGLEKSGASNAAVRRIRNQKRDLSTLTG